MTDNDFRWVKGIIAGVVLVAALWWLAVIEFAH